MQIFADTTDLDALKHYREMGLIKGVATNPEVFGMCGAANPMQPWPVCGGY